MKFETTAAILASADRPVLAGHDKGQLRSVTLALLHCSDCDTNILTNYSLHAGCVACGSTLIPSESIVQKDTAGNPLTDKDGDTVIATIDVDKSALANLEIVATCTECDTTFRSDAVFASSLSNEQIYCPVCSSVLEIAAEATPDATPEAAPAEEEAPAEPLNDNAGDEPSTAMTDDDVKADGQLITSNAKHTKEHHDKHKPEHKAEEPSEKKPDHKAEHEEKKPEHKPEDKKVEKTEEVKATSETPVVEDEGLKDTGATGPKVVKITANELLEAPKAAEHKHDEKCEGKGCKDVTAAEDAPKADETKAEDTKTDAKGDEGSEEHHKKHHDKHKEHAKHEHKEHAKHEHKEHAKHEHKKHAEKTDDESAEATKKTDEAPKAEETKEVKAILEVDASVMLLGGNATSYNFVMSSADKPTWFLFADNRPVAWSDKTAVSANLAKHYDSQAFGKAFAAAAADGITPELIKEFGLAASTIRFETDEVTACAIKTAVEAKTKELNDRLVQVKSSFEQAVGIAAVGVNKNFFADAPNTLRKALVSVLSSINVNHPEHLVDSVLAQHGQDYLKAIIAKAMDLQTKSPDMLNEYANLVESAPYTSGVVSTPSSAGERHANELAAGSMPLSVSASLMEDKPVAPQDNIRRLFKDIGRTPRRI